jgi:hypothetical protein
MRAALLLAVAVLYLVSVPWYREPGETPGVLLGLPDWVTVALGCYGLVAVLNAWAWLRTEVPDVEPGGAERGEGDAGGGDAP